MKFDLRVNAYGTVDETNAAIGLARLHCQKTDIDAILELTQNDLFDLGADLSTPEDTLRKKDGRKKHESLRMTPGQTFTLERYIDEFNRKLEPLRSFVLCGGSALAAHLHLARTIARRAERHIVELSRTSGEIVNPSVIIYMNRLSDLLFVLARYANDSGKADILWKPGKNR